MTETNHQKSPFFKVNEKCNGCLACVQNCPAQALSFEDDGDQRTLKHNMGICARCGTCWRVCPQGAVEFQHFMKSTWNDVVTMKLVHCDICGEPLYTTNFEESLSNKLNHEIKTLCPQHRKELPISAWKRLLPMSNASKEVSAG